MKIGVLWALEISSFNGREQYSTTVHLLWDNPVKVTETAAY